ncbi:MAG: 4'-phosphopantetheinyl transferase superfamily protein [Chloroflexi bacterium]|nr:MAG: 4'-phosphopantetheinyl transferase superfamily protein [Chloroflexota bacterium]
MYNAECSWSVPDLPPVLSPAEVHVWCASLVAAPATIQTLRPLLSADELTRANRFYFEKDRHHFIVARGVLRILLGRYLTMPPAQLRFSYNEYGKPFLDLTSRTPILQFNISHSQDFALLAFTSNRLVGVDIEYMRVIEFEQLAEHSFSPYEQVTLQALPLSVRHAGFYNCWTRKEAYIKARGRGLSLPLDSFDVSLRPGEAARLLASREDRREVQRWSLQALTPPAGYAGALAVEGRDWQLKQWRWTFAAE